MGEKFRALSAVTLSVNGTIKKLPIGVPIAQEKNEKLISMADFIYGFLSLLISCNYEELLEPFLYVDFIAVRFANSRSDFIKKNPNCWGVCQSYADNETDAEVYTDIDIHYNYIMQYVTKRLKALNKTSKNFEQLIYNEVVIFTLIHEAVHCRRNHFLYHNLEEALNNSEFDELLEEVNVDSEAYKLLLTLPNEHELNTIKSFARCKLADSIYDAEEYYHEHREVIEKEAD